MLSSQQHAPTLSSPTNGFITPQGPWSGAEFFCDAGQSRRRAKAVVNSVDACGGVPSLGSVGALRRSSRLLLDSGIGAPSRLVLASPNTRPNDNFLYRKKQQQYQQQKHQHQHQQQKEQQHHNHHHQLHQHQHQHQHQEKQQQQQKKQQQHQQQQRSRTTVLRPKRRTVVGTVCRLLLRSKPSSASCSSSSTEKREARSTAPGGSTKTAAAAATTTPDKNYNYKSPRSRRLLFSSTGSKLSSTRPRSLSPVCVVATDDVGSAPTLGGCNNPNRPTRSDQVENFHRALDNELVRLAFGDFCNKTLSSENVEFVRQVRELDQLSRDDDATAAELREKLRHVADAFVRPESVTEVNVKGSTREFVLDCIQAALGTDAKRAGNGSGNVDGGGWGADGESPWAWVLAVEATEALVGLAREVHPVIFNGIWPRFLLSEEFAVMMNAQEMRTVGFTNLDGKQIISQMPPPPPSRRLPPKKRMERPSAFLRPARAGAVGGRMDVSPVPSSTSNNSSLDSNVDVEVAAAAAAGVSGVTSSIRPASVHRHCRTSFRARPASQQGSGYSSSSSRAGIAFGGLPTRWSRGLRKDVTRAPASASAEASPTTGAMLEGRSSSTRRAFSLR